MLVFLYFEGIIVYIAGMAIKTSEEVLTHFECGKCSRWWSIGDLPEDEREWWCPWCGEKGEVSG